MQFYRNVQVGDIYEVKYFDFPKPSMSLYFLREDPVYLLISKIDFRTNVDTGLFCLPLKDDKESRIYYDTYYPDGMYIITMPEIFRLT